MISTCSSCSFLNYLMWPGPLSGLSLSQRTHDGCPRCYYYLTLVRRDVHGAGSEASIPSRETRQWDQPEKLPQSRLFQVLHSLICRSLCIRVNGASFILVSEASIQTRECSLSICFISQPLLAARSPAPALARRKAGRPQPRSKQRWNSKMQIVILQPHPRRDLNRGRQIERKAW